jgi:hypothetical protein
MNWRTRTLVIGGVVGLLVGIAGAYIVIQRSEQNSTLPAVSAGDGVKVGLGVLGVLRLIAEIAERG